MGLPEWLWVPEFDGETEKHELSVVHRTEKEGG
jgi:hypothetical protein